MLSAYNYLFSVMATNGEDDDYYDTDLNSFFLTFQVTRQRCTGVF